MRVLIACEFSGLVREAFRDFGHDAWSCDLRPTEIPGPHIVGDVTAILRDDWDLMVAHPPCTYLSRLAARWLSRPGRLALRDEAMRFFMTLWNAPILKIAIENPIGYPWQAFRRPDEVINPFEFGEPERKRTCLWLKNLPILLPSALLEPPAAVFIGSDGTNRHFTQRLGGKDKSKNRSRTFQGIAHAMARQWGR